MNENKHDDAKCAPVERRVIHEQKIHQTSSFEYQIRIDGEPVRHSTILTKDELDIYLDLCKTNAHKYVDIVVVRTEILINQFNYSQMKKHFETQK